MGDVRKPNMSSTVWSSLGSGDNQFIPPEDSVNVHVFARMVPPLLPPPIRHRIRHPPGINPQTQQRNGWRCVGRQPRTTVGFAPPPPPRTTNTRTPEPPHQNQLCWRMGWIFPSAPRLCDEIERTNKRDVAILINLMYLVKVWRVL